MATHGDHFAVPPARRDRDNRRPTEQVLLNLNSAGVMAIEAEEDGRKDCQHSRGGDRKTVGAYRSWLFLLQAQRIILRTLGFGGLFGGARERAEWCGDWVTNWARAS
jgi:hypothetical protein